MAKDGNNEKEAIASPQKKDAVGPDKAASGPPKGPIGPEPTFTLKAGDPFALPALKNYAKLCQGIEHAKAMQAFGQFLDWTNQQKG